MSGYIFDYYKYIRIEDDKDILEDFNSELQEKSSKINYITFGEFDRLEVSRVTDFTRYRDLSKSSKDWWGDRLPILLYEIDDSNQICYNEKCFIIKENGNERENDMLFIGLTIFQFRYSQIKNITDVSEFIKDFKQRIIEVLNERELDLKFGVFGVLGTNGISILWLADQYESILNSINYLKGYFVNGKVQSKPNSLFLSVKTIFSKNDFNKNMLPQKKISEIKGKALLQITVKTCLNKNTKHFICNNFEKDFSEKINTFHCAGEYDLVLSVNSSDIYTKFDKGQSFNRRNTFYSNNILQTNVLLCRENDIYFDISDKTVKSSTENKNEEENNQDREQDSDFKECIKQVQDNYKKLRIMLKTIYPKTAGMADTLDLLYCDFNTKISSGVNNMWVIDFAYQFNGIIECLSDLTENLNAIEITTVKYLELVKEILNNFKHQVFHIAESNHLNLEPPVCHLRYTGHCNLILYAYFGIIKKIIELIYSFQEVNKQSEIIPLITVDTMPIVESSLFIDYKNYQAPRIITINLPEACLFDLPRYIIFMYHELFHYAVPQDRYVRDKLLGMLYINEILRDLTVLCITNNSDIDIDGGIEDQYKVKLRRSVSEIIYNFVIETYDEIDESIISFNVLGEKYKDIDKGEVTRDIYEENLYKATLKWLDINSINEKRILQRYFSYLIANRSKIEEKLEDQIRGKFLEKSAYKSENLKSILKQFLDLLEKLEEKKKSDESININNLLDKIKEPVEKVYINSENLISALREVSADIPMVNLSEVNEVQYLIFCIMIKKNLLINIDFEDNSDNLRIAIVLDYILGFEEKDRCSKISEKKEEFINTYIGLYFSTTSLRDVEDKEKQYYSLEVEADKWFEKYISLYNDHIKEYGIYFEILKKYCEVEDLKKRNNEIYQRYLNQNKEIDIKGYCNIFKDYGAKIKYFIINKKYSEILTERVTLNKKIFDMNIVLIQKYQYYKSFSEISKSRNENYKSEKRYQGLIKVREMFQMSTNYNKRNTEIKNGYRLEYKADSFQKLCGLIDELASRLQKQHKLLNIHNSSALWYRGHKKNISYKLIPVLMRNFKEKKRFYGTLENYQKAEFEEFKFRADGAPEFGWRNDITTCDYLAIMQHYSVPTSLLDWSEDALTALYFALESYLDSSKNENIKEDAVLYLLSPTLYNKARNEILEECERNINRRNKNNKNRTSKIIKDIIDTKKMSISVLPNLSAKYNNNMYNMFLLGSNKYKNELDLEDYKEEVKLDFNEKGIYLPLAICTSRLNARLRSQSGMFMAYNIYAYPNEGSDYDYQDLENIQKFYLDRFNQKRNAGEREVEPFMYKIRIDRKSCPKIAELLEKFGISKEKIYPELNNIGERVKKHR